MGFDIGGFAQGLGDGQQFVERFRASRQAEQDRRQQQQAQAAAAQGWLTPEAPQAPMPGQPSVPMGPGGVAPMGAGGPPMGAGPAPLSIPGATPMPPGVGGAPMPGAPSMAPAAGPPPPPPGVPPTGAGGGALSATAMPSQRANPVQDSRQTLAAIATNIAKANPNIDLNTLYSAVQQQVEMMKGVQPEVQSAMVYQTQIAKADVDFQQAANQAKHWDELYDAQQRRIEALVEAQRIAAESRERVAATNAGSRERVAGTNAGARVQAAGIGAGARVQAAGIGAGARTDSARINADARLDASANAADARGYEADTRAASSTFRTRAGGMPTKEAAPASPRRPAPRASRGGGPSQPVVRTAAPTYATPQAVADAYRSGKITREQAASTLQSRFGIK